jgi:hypothetical protein
LRFAIADTPVHFFTGDCFDAQHFILPPGRRGSGFLGLSGFALSGSVIGQSPLYWGQFRAFLYPAACASASVLICLLRRSSQVKLFDYFFPNFGPDIVEGPIKTTVVI